MTERIAIRCIGIVSKVLNVLVLTLILLVMGYGCYGVWDSNHVAQSASGEFYQIYKPTESKASFEELQRINDDVLGWLTIYGTAIDYPLVQGENNSKYINTDAMGKYSMTGALFMDCTNDRHFGDFNTIIYGHNMVPSAMFGRIKEFKEPYFFDGHKYGNLFYDGRNYGIEFFAIIESDAYDSKVYHPGITDKERGREYVQYILSKAACRRDVELEDGCRIILLSTCSIVETNARDILVGKIVDNVFPDSFAENSSDKTSDMEGMFNRKGDFLVVVVAAFFVLLLILFLWLLLRKPDKRRRRIANKD